MIAWILDRAKERSTWMGLFSLAGAIGLAFALEHKELAITAAVAVVAAIAAILPWSDTLRPWLNRRGRPPDGCSNPARHRRPRLSAQTCAGAETEYP